MNWMALFLNLLPSLIKGAETIGADIAGHQKKAAVTDSLTALASGVAAAAPEHGQAATVAAQTAIAAIDGVVATIKAVQSEPAPVAAPVAVAYANAHVPA